MLCTLFFYNSRLVSQNLHSIRSGQAAKSIISFRQSRSNFFFSFYFLSYHTPINLSISLILKLIKRRRSKQTQSATTHHKLVVPVIILPLFHYFFPFPLPLAPSSIFPFHKPQVMCFRRHLRCYPPPPTILSRFADPTIIFASFLSSFSSFPSFSVLVRPSISFHHQSVSHSPLNQW